VRRHAVRLSKIVDYLVDNQYTCMLSDVEAGDQGESGGAVGAIPIWECRAGVLVPCGAASREADYRSAGRRCATRGLFPLDTKLP
jgi:hypothetical protein